MQNWTSRREDDYKRILGTRYRGPLRSILQGSPGDDEPWLLVDFDLKGAELFVVAVQSGDALMIDHCRRNNLPDDHPDYYEIHSNVAVKAFNLGCPPTKKGLKSIGKVGLRTAAKNIIFGLLYGRGDEAVMRAVEEEGEKVTMEEVRVIRQLILGTYRGLGAYLDAAGDRPFSHGFLRSCFRRARRFPTEGADQERLSAMSREARNLPIQAAVADLVYRWMHKLHGIENRHRPDGSPRFRMLMQVHDSVICEARASDLEWFGDVIERTLSEIPMYRCDLDGNPLPGLPPYYMGTSIEVFEQWSVPLTRTRGLELGVPARFLPKEV